MKFTDGYWRFQDGVTPHFPAHVYDVEVSADVLTVYGAIKRIEARGDTLNVGLLTVRFSSPMQNVIRVQIIHHKGQRPSQPNFALSCEPTEVCIEEDDACATLTSGQLSVRVAKGADWRVDFFDDGRLLTHSGWRGMGYTDVAGTGRFVHEQLGLSVGECVYGLGERFTPFVKNGQVINLWNEDGGTSSEQAYKNVPFYLTNRGYGVFINHPEHVSLEVGSEKVERVQFSVAGESLDYCIINGPTPKQVLQRYTSLTGKPALPPAWSFGLWLSTSFTTSYDEATVTRFVQGMADRDIPLHVFHFDCFWMREFHWSNFEWDARVFPDPAGMLGRLKARGLRICVWINPYIAQRSALFDEGMAHGYLVTRPNGHVWQWDRWQAGMGLVDFTNPAACAWFQDKLRDLLDMGVDCFKTDFGERIPTEVIFHDGSDPQRMHNYYTHLYNKAVFELLQAERGVGDAVLFARSATAGGQQFPVHWGGDCSATFESMAESLRGGLSLSLSGFGFWSHDIGGFEQTASAAVYKRWCAFGLLSSHSRLHGNESYRVPWLFDEEAVDVLRHFTKLKCRLMPYLFAAAVEAHQQGIPTMRAMMLEFPDDPGCDYLDRQYMLGESLLVAPVFSASGEVAYYVPEGRWTDLLTGAVIEGARWRRETHNFMSVPLLIRPNTVLPIGQNDTRPDYDFADSVTLHIYQLDAGRTVTTVIPALDGTPDVTFTVSRQNSQIRVTREGTPKAWRVLLVGVAGVQSAENAAITPHPTGTLITPNRQTTLLELTVVDHT